MEQLSDKERTLLAYIKERLADQIPPTVREICRDLQIKSTSSAHRYLKSLEAKGYISMGDNENRTIRLSRGRERGRAGTGARHRHRGTADPRV